MQYEYQCILLIRLGFSGDQNMICEWKNIQHLGHARNLNKWPNWAAVVGSIMGKASRRKQHLNPLLLLLLLQIHVKAPSQAANPWNIRQGQQR